METTITNLYRVHNIKSKYWIGCLLFLNKNDINLKQLTNDLYIINSTYNKLIEDNIILYLGCIRKFNIYEKDLKNHYIVYFIIKIIDKDVLDIDIVNFMKNRYNNEPYCLHPIEEDDVYKYRKILKMADYFEDLKYKKDEDILVDQRNKYNEIFEILNEI